MVGQEKFIEQLNKYTLKKPDNVEEIVKGLKNQKEIKIYKK